MAQQGVGQRVRRAFHAWASQNEQPVTYADFGVALARELGRDEPFSSSLVSEWIAERSEPSGRAYLAIARLSGFREAWLIDAEAPARTAEYQWDRPEVQMVAPPAPELPAAQTLPHHGVSLPDNSQERPSEQRGRKRAHGR